MASSFCLAWQVDGAASEAPVRVVTDSFTGYVISEQRRPSKKAARAAFLSMVFSNQFCFIVVGRLVWVAWGKARPDDSVARVEPAKEEGLEAGMFDVPGA